jgi:hypothetical protein
MSWFLFNPQLTKKGLQRAKTVNSASPREMVVDCPVGFVYQIDGQWWMQGAS